MQDTRSEAAYHSTKLCFLILTCVSEDEYASALMHDAGLTFRIPLHRLPMRHRKAAADKTLPFRPLVCGLLGKRTKQKLTKKNLKTDNFSLEIRLLTLGIFFER